MAIHPVAQRKLQPAWLKKLVDKFDLDALGSFHAVRYARDGSVKTWIIDGQHRQKALIELGIGEWEVDVMIHVDIKSDAAAARLFRLLNTRKVVAPFDAFNADLAAGDSICVGISDVVRKHGLKIAEQCCDGNISAVVSLRRSYRIDDGKSLDRALGLTNASWGKKAAALEGKIIEGLTLLAAHADGSLEEDSLVKKLSKACGPSQLIGDAKGRLTYQKGSLARAIASQIIDIYNSGRRGGRLDPL